MKNEDYMIFVSLDAMSTDDFNDLLKLDGLNETLKGYSIVKHVSSVFVSNTYTAHASIVSGCNPCRHGVIDNTLFSPGNPSPDWMWQENYIKTNTIIREAYEQNVPVATIMWPVTGKGKISNNLPEIFSNRKWDNQLCTSLRNGSKMFQIKALIRHGKLLNGAHEPELDNFVFETLKDTIKSKKANMIFVHLTDVDSYKHKFGIKSHEVEKAIVRHGDRIKQLMKLLRQEKILDKTTLFFFGDHAQFDVNHSIEINRIVENLGYAKFDGKKLLSWDAWFKCCGGTAFLRLADKSNKKIADTIKNNIKGKIADKNSKIGRLLTTEEMRISGFNKDYEFGIEATKGSYFYECDSDIDKKGNHGYTINNEKYTTSLIAMGNGIRKNIVCDNKSILDICPTALMIAGFNSWEMDGKVIKELIV